MGIPPSSVSTRAEPGTASPGRRACRTLPAMRSTLPLSALAVLVACALSSACQGARLASLHQPRISVLPVQVDERDTDSHVYEFKVVLFHQGDCIPLDGAVRGTINDQPAPKWFAGEVREGHSILYGQVNGCVYPSFHLPLQAADADQVTVAFEDGPDRLSATFLNLGRAPSLTVTPPQDGHIRPGSTISLTYAPATDDLSRARWTLSGPTPTNVDLGQRQGATVQFTIPAGQPAGSATISASDPRTPGVASCEGASECSAAINWLPFPEAAAVFQPVSVTFTVEP